MRNRPVPFVSDADRAFVRGLLIHEDAALLAFNKPSGLPVQSRGNKACCLDELLWAFARSNGKRPRLVHRLDAGTSGLIIAAKTKPAAASLSAAFEARQVQKRYLAVVSGDPGPEAQGLIEAPLRTVERSPDGQRPAYAQAVRADERGALPAQTQWAVLKRAGNHCLLAVKPKTGRMHQIRAHLAHAGMAIIGDDLYGEPDDRAGRLMLHAAALTFPHPDGDTQTIEAQPQPDFNSGLEGVGL